MDLTKKSKAERLALFLKEVALSKTQLVRDVEDYKQRCWFEDVPSIDSCRHAAAVSGDEEELPSGVWLRVDDQDIPAPPSPPEGLLPWLREEDLEHPTEEPPKLQGSAILADPDWNPDVSDEPARLSVRLADRPGVEQLYQSYCSTWREWAASLRERIRAQALYRKLYAIHRELEREGENLQLCLGMGLLDWPKPGGTGARIRRHVITVTAELQFEAQKGVIQVMAPEEGTRVMLEHDMLEPSVRPSQEAIFEVEELLKGVQEDDAIWNRERVFQALQTWARHLHPDTKWSPGLDRAPGENEVPMLGWSPAILLRTRGEGGTLRVYDTIAEQIGGSAGGDASKGESGPVPDGWKQVIEPIDDRIVGPAGEGSRGDWPDLEGEVFFPLPANQQQRDILDAVRSRRGVVVQGPPGTGKSHTIANLMTHLLASGQRVLVTAENPRALAVLRDKLPNQLRALCVAVLGQGGESFDALSQTIREITERQTRWDEALEERAIERLRERLEEVRRKLRCAQDEVKALRMGETVAHDPAPGYSGAPAKIAKLVTGGRGRFDWLSIPDEAAPEAPLSNAEATRWLELLLQVDPAVEPKLDQRVVEVDWFPSDEDLAAEFSRAPALQARLSAFASEMAMPAFSVLAGMTEVDLDALHAQFVELRDMWARFPRTEWMQEAARAARTGEIGPWQILLKRTQSTFEEVERGVIELRGRRVEIPEGLDPKQVRNDATAVLEHLRAGGKWKRLLGLGSPKAVQGREYLRERVTVDASVADEAHELEAVVQDMTRRLAVRKSASEWEPYVTLVAGATDDALYDHIAWCVEELERALREGEVDRALRERLQSRLGMVLQEDWMSSEEYDWPQAVEAARTSVRLSNHEAMVQRIVDGLDAIAQQHDASPLVARARDAVKARDVAAYGSAMDQIRELGRLRRLRNERDALEERLAKGAPDLKERVRQERLEAAWQDRLPQLEEAWAWHFADRWLRRLNEPGRLATVERERKKAEQEETDLTVELAAKLAWQHFFQRLTPAQTSSLRSWLNSVKQMGKGTGRSARLLRLKQDARRHLEACRDAIPVWVMPRYLLSEMVGVTPERFDTVIVDEASQMGLEGMFVFYVGKRTVIVGDDQQISPSDVGVKDEIMEDLRKRFLWDFDHAQALGRGGNVYAYAQIMFQRQVTLREHFRCMPEIIDYSDNLCYAPHGTPLDPMRSFGEARLTPLMCVRVEGQRAGGSQSPTNKVEAEAIVAKIEECLDDPAYDGKSIGVISLTGKAQAKLIERLLLVHIEPEILEERRVLCGDAYAFQGDERHVVFLSMVVAPGEVRLSAQTSASAVQRFNVAVSRAQDQLWLFHSVDLADLKSTCVRYQLLSHMKHRPSVDEQAAQQTFESPFEEAVFRAIVGRGYRAKTQVPVGNNAYRIDIVVHSGAEKLAIECDGDHWHGPERWAEDWARQRDLERVGWEFFRIAGSTYYRDPHEALEPLWAALVDRGIRPVSVQHDEEAEAETEEEQAEAEATVTPPPVQVDVEEASTSTEPPSMPEIDGKPVESDNSTVTSASANVTQPWSFAPDPREAASSAVIPILVELTEIHGPLSEQSLLQRYAKAAGIGRLGHKVRSSILKAIHAAVREERLTSEEIPKVGGVEAMLLAPGGRPVCVRERDGREFEEILLPEWTLLLQQLESHPSSMEPEQVESLFRRAMDHYGFTGLTQRRLSVLQEALRIAIKAQEADRA